MNGAVSSGNLELVKSLLDEGHNHHYTLHLAIRHGHLDIVIELLNRGVDIHINRDLALYIACCNGYTAIVIELLNRGADIHIDDNCAIRGAAYNGHIEIVRELLNRGADTHSALRELKYKASLGDRDKEIKHFLLIWQQRKKYLRVWQRWRKIMIRQWARRLLQVWYRPDMYGGILAKKDLARF